MAFMNGLNKIITTINCTNRDLSSASGLSEAVISRYRNGIRAPREGSDKLNMLVSGLAKLAEENDIPLSKEDIFTSLSRGNNDDSANDTLLFAENTKKLLSEMKVTIKELSTGIGYDPTYLSRILRGERTPKKLDKIVALVSAYFARHAAEKNKLRELADVMGFENDLPDNPADLQHIIGTFLSPKYDISAAENIPSNSRLDSFLQKLDEFDLDDYIKVIHFNDIRLPTAPFQIPRSQEYSGIEAFKESEIDFMKTVVLSRSKCSVTLYSDMPITEMAKDVDFSRKYMFGLAMMIKKGLHIDFIHDVNRPWNEMMIGLESNIPLYMTGQISPFYLRNSESRVFRHLIKVSGSAALVGEAITDHHDKGRYYLTTKKEDVRYYRERAAALLDQALPLMDIYTSDKSAEFLSYLADSYAIKGDRKMIFSCLPLFTMSSELLDRILSDNGIKSDAAVKIRGFSMQQRERITDLCMSNHIDLVVPALAANAFDEKPPVLSVPELFLDSGLRLTPEIYSAHLTQTQEFADSLHNCTLDISEKLTFSNIDITIIKGSEVLVSKAKSPTIHFVIKHPRMVKSFENYTVPIIL